MSSATGRRIEVLAALQRQPGITAERQAARHGVTHLTVRRDVAHLRAVGYRIDSEPGRHGGYTLAAGSALPPLALDADEALAVAVGLRTAAGSAGLAPAAATALAKLTETVPPRLRARMEAVAGTEIAGRPDPRDPDGGVLIALALACRVGEAVRFRHRRHDGEPGRARDVQPHRLVALGRRWYLVGCERDTARWKTYRVDRIEDVRPLGTRLPAPPPPADPAAFVTDALALGRRGHRVRVRLHTSAELAARLVDPATGRVEPDGDGAVLTFGTDDLDRAARWLLWLGVDLDVLDPPELAGTLHALGRWLTARYPSGSSHSSGDGTIEES